MAIDPDALRDEIIVNFASEFGEIQPRGLEGLENAMKAIADAVATHHNADAGGGAGIGAGGELVFEWNGSDTTQFDTTTVYSAGGSLGTPTLSVETDADLPGGKKLRMAVSGTGEGYAVILANDALQSKSFIIEVETAAVGTNGQGLAWYAEDSSGLYCYANTMIGTARHFRVDAGTASTFSATGITTTVASARGYTRFRMRGDKVSGGTHRGLMNAVGGYSAFAAVRGYARGIRQDFPDEPAPAGWNSLTANRWGLCLYAASGAAGGPMDIASLRVYEL